HPLTLFFFTAPPTSGLYTLSLHDALPISSSMREPVSISAVAMMVSDPPSSTLRAAPRKRLGRCSALASTPPVSTLPDEGTTLLRSEEHTSELQSRFDLVCRLLLEKKKTNI